MRAAVSIRHGAVGDDAEERFLGAADWPMCAAGEARFAASRRSCGCAWRPMRSIAATWRDRADGETVGAGTRHPVRVRPALREMEMGAWQGLLRRELAERQPMSTLRAEKTSSISVRRAARASPTSPRACCRAGAAWSKTARRKSSRSPATPASIGSYCATCWACRSTMCFALRRARAASTSLNGGGTSRS